MTYSEATDWLFGQLPMYQRQGAAAYKANLNGTFEVLEKLGRPDLQLPHVIHVAGTNGKGSVCTAIAEALSSQGQRVGLFTSPHLVDYRERMRVNGVMPEKDWIAHFVGAHQHLFAEQEIQPSFFEWTFGMALCWFVESQVDAVVLETGMGGRLDSTNVFRSPLLTVITNVGLDHQQFLGADIRSIAREKAGIVKEGVPVVMGRMRPEAQSVVLAAASRMGSETHYAAVSQSLNTEREGPHWPENRATAHKALEVLASLPFGKGLSIPPMEILSKASHRGRWQWLNAQACAGRVLVDCAHNMDGLERTLDALDGMSFAGWHVVIGAVADKDLTEFLSRLREESQYYFCAADIPRALPAQQLAEAAENFGLKGLAYPSVDQAFKAACETATDEDLVLVLGSIFVVAEVLVNEA